MIVKEKNISNDKSGLFYSSVPPPNQLEIILATFIHSHLEQALWILGKQRPLLRGCLGKGWAACMEMSLNWVRQHLLIESSQSMCSLTVLFQGLTAFRGPWRDLTWIWLVANSIAAPPHDLIDHSLAISISWTTFQIQSSQSPLHNGTIHRVNFRGFSFLVNFAKRMYLAHFTPKKAHKWLILSSQDLRSIAFSYCNNLKEILGRVLCQRFLTRK